MTDILPTVRAKRTAIDEKLLANARKSMNDLAEMTGLQATEVSERLSRLLEDIGWMNERQDERFMLIELGELISESRDRLKKTDDENYAGIAKIVLGAMQQMADRWDKRKKLVEEDIEAITRANARTFGRAYSIAGNDIIHSIQQLFPDVKLSDTEKYSIMKSALGKADKMLETKVKAD